MPQSLVKVDRKHHFKETCFNHVHRTSCFRELEKLKRKQVNSTARSADMAERRAAKHCCLRWNLWVVSFNWKSVFNLATVGPILMISTPMIFQFWSNAEKIKARAHRWAPARKKRYTRLANFGPKFWFLFFFFVRQPLESCRNWSAILGANLSQKLPRDPRCNPENLEKMWPRRSKNWTSFFAHLC